MFCNLGKRERERQTERDRERENMYINARAAKQVTTTESYFRSPGLAHIKSLLACGKDRGYNRFVFSSLLFTHLHQCRLAHSHQENQIS
jgi:hypothetical protein